MSSVLKPEERDDGLEAAVEQAIAVCDGDPRAAVRALIIANSLLESGDSGSEEVRIARLHARALSDLHRINVGVRQKAMKHQDKLSLITDDQAEHMGADMAIQFMLMMLFQLVSEMADDPRGLRADVHKELADLVATYNLPPMPADAEQKSRAAARKILDGIMLRSFEPNVARKAS